MVKLVNALRSVGFTDEQIKDELARLRPTGGSTGRRTAPGRRRGVSSSSAAAGPQGCPAVHHPRRGRFVKVWLRDRENASRYSRLPCGYGVSPNDAALWTRAKRPALCELAAFSWRAAEEWLTRWHDQQSALTAKEVSECHNQQLPKRSSTSPWTRSKRAGWNPNREDRRALDALPDHTPDSRALPALREPPED